MIPEQEVFIAFQEKAGFKITAPVENPVAANSSEGQGHRVTTYKHGLVGEKYGEMKGKN